MFGYTDVKNILNILICFEFKIIGKRNEVFLFGNIKMPPFEANKILAFFTSVWSQRGLGEKLFKNVMFRYTVLEFVRRT